MKWEYLLEDLPQVDNPPGLSRHESRKMVLNDHGEEEWEAVTAWPKANATGVVTVLYKRAFFSADN